MHTKTKELTARETEVLGDLAADLTTKDIAEKYGVTMGTVATYRHSILRKAGCRTSSGAVAKLFVKQP